MPKQPCVITEFPLEARLILSTARANPTAEQLDLAKTLVRTKPRWDHVVRLAEQNYVVPLLYRSLARLGTDEVPKDVLDALRVRSKMIAWRNQIFHDELERLNGLFHSNGVAVIHYKGPVLENMVYGNIGLRTFNDLDFLVERQHLPIVKRLLCEQGYRPKGNKKEFNESQEALIEKEQKEYAFTSGPINIEPHWSITARRFPFCVDYTALWCRAINVPFGATKVLTFSPDDLLLVLCVVGSKGKWQRLQMISDVAETLRQFPYSGVSVLQTAQRLGSERMLLVGCLLASEFCGAPLPPVIMSRARSDRKVVKLTTAIAHSLFNQPRPPRLLDPSARIFSPLLFRLRERPQDKLHYLLRTTTTPTGFHLCRFPLPHNLFFLYRLIVPTYDYLACPAFRLGKSLFRRSSLHSDHGDSESVKQ